MRNPNDQQIALECLRLTGGDIRRAEIAFDFVKGESAAPSNEKPGADNAVSRLPSQ
jgi:hypothetical protein